MDEQPQNPRPLEYATRGALSPKTPLSPAVLWTIVVLILLGVFLLAGPLLLPFDRTSGQEQDGTLKVSILRPEIAENREWVRMAGFFVLLAPSAILLRRKRILFGVLLLLASIAAFVLSFGMGVLDRLGPWTLCDSVCASDGNRYCFIDSSFLQGQDLAIGRVTSSGPLYLSMDVLGDTNGDSPRSYLLVLRPSPPKAVRYGAIYATSNGLVVGLRSGNQCYMVYDIPNKRFYGHDDVETLSPFLLLDDKGAIHSPDEAEIIKATGGSDAEHLPSRASLEAASAHPNPAVRQSAARMLQAMKAK